MHSVIVALLRPRASSPRANERRTRRQKKSDDTNAQPARPMLKRGFRPTRSLPCTSTTNHQHTLAYLSRVVCFSLSRFLRAMLVGRLDAWLRRYRPSMVVGGTLLSAALTLALYRLLTTPWDGAPPPPLRHSLRLSYAPLPVCRPQSRCAAPYHGGRQAGGRRGHD